MSLAIFFCEISRSPQFANIQYANHKVTKTFQLKEFLESWRTKLGRKEISINVAHSRVTHGNGVLSFETEYDSAWEEEPSKSSLHDLPTPVSPAPWMIYLHQDDDDLFKPIYGNQLPMNKKGGPQYPVKSYYQLVEPRLYDGQRGQTSENSTGRTSATYRRPRLMQKPCLTRCRHG